MSKTTGKHHPVTIKAIAAALGVTPRRVSQLKLAGMPTDSIAASEAWRKREDLGNADFSPERLRASRIKLLDLQAERQQIENDKTTGLLVPIGEVKADAVRFTYGAKTALLGLLGSLPPSLCGLPNEIAIFKVLKSAFYDVLTKLSEGQFMAGPEVDAIIESMKPNQKTKL